MELYFELCTIMPEFKKFDLDQIYRLVSLIHSRSFSLPIGGKKVTCLVPFASMINHKSISTEPSDCENNKQLTFWSYDRNRDGFMIKAGQDIKKGKEVFFTYGSTKTNLNFFLIYGFVLEDESAASALIKL